MLLLVIPWSPSSFFLASLVGSSLVIFLISRWFSCWIFLRSLLGSLVGPPLVLFWEVYIYSIYENEVEQPRALDDHAERLGHLREDPERPGGVTGYLVDLPLVLLLVLP